jgi:hypothetical protein
LLQFFLLKIVFFQVFNLEHLARLGGIHLNQKLIVFMLNSPNFSLAATFIEGLMLVVAHDYSFGLLVAEVLLVQNF